MSSSDCTTTSVFGGVAANATAGSAASRNSGKSLAFIGVYPLKAPPGGAENGLLSLVFTARAPSACHGRTFARGGQRPIRYLIFQEYISRPGRGRQGGGEDCQRVSLSVATSTALMVCSRFSA